MSLRGSNEAVSRMDTSASEALHADGAPPADGASHDDGGDVTLLYSHGPCAGIQVKASGWG